MNTRLAAGSGIGLVAGAAVGVMIDAMSGAHGTAMIVGAARRLQEAA